MKKSFVFLASAALLANAPLAVLAQEAESNNPESSVVESGSDESVSNEDTPVEGEENPGEETPGEESTENEESAPTEGEESTEESTPTEGEENPGEGEETPTEGEENPGEGEETPNEGEELPDPDAWDITEDQSLYTYPTTYDNFQEADEQAIAIALQGIQFEGQDIASRYRVAKNDETGLYEITFVIDAPEGTYEYEIDASGNVVVEAVESEVPGEEEESSNEEETSNEDDETSEEETSSEDDETSEEESSEEDDETSEEENEDDEENEDGEENEDDEEPVNTDSFDRASWKSILTQLSDITDDEFENLSDEDYVRAILAVNERDGKVEPQKLVDYLKAEHPDAFADASETPNEEEEESSNEEEDSNEEESSNEEETSNEDEENTDEEDAEEKDAEEQLEEEAAKVVEDNKKVEVKESVEGRPELPETGESRTPLLTTIGASLLALGSAILVKFRKKEEA